MTTLTDSQIAEYVSCHHTHQCGRNQTSSMLIKRIRAPVETVWSFVRRFDKPQCYKTFIKSCSMSGELKEGSVREVHVVSGLPASTSTEILQKFDEKNHILSYRVLGGEHRLQNYNSIITLHPDVVDDKPATLVIESYSVDVPEGNTHEDTKFYVETLIKCNLKSLSDSCERLVSSNSQAILGTN
ncbi:hypothetical protein KP509_12G088600 [Ceratopteris richardii]|uniref:Uncharacterized protein n=1 Tax=Ceratopteris richardii TaxID=49495 RepID=A0A8T2TRN3_CERRI|nr:hypothetical protein KP509_12G088600 [Ceratopteris richardii]